MTGIDSMRLSRNNRGLAVNIGLFFATLIMGALLWMVVQEPAEMVLNLAAEQTERESSRQGQAYVSHAIANVHLIVIGLGVLQLVIAAVYESKVGR